MNRILGVDPGSRITGYGVIEIANNQLLYIASGCIRVGKFEMFERMRQIADGIDELITTHRVKDFAMEEVFVASNPQTALKLGQARGAVMVAAARHNTRLGEYAARTVKKSVTGNGSATKQQVQFMVKTLLNLDREPASDAADALAVAICHWRENSGIGARANSRL